MSGDVIRIEQNEGVLRLVLDRPERKNSLTPDAVGRLIETLESAATDDTVRVVSLESSGPDFCTGADVVAANQKAERRDVAIGQRSLNRQQPEARGSA